MAITPLVKARNHPLGEGPHSLDTLNREATPEKSAEAQQPCYGMDAW